VRISTAQVRLSFSGGAINVTDEAVAIAAELGMNVEQLISEPRFLDWLSETVTAKLPVGEPITIAHELHLSPNPTGVRPQAIL
jgi:hypothetical protein